MAFQKEHKHTEQTKIKISLANKGQISWRKGKKFVDENISREKRKEYRKRWTLLNKDKLLEQGRDWRKQIEIRFYFTSKTEI
jgi:hypothetical protein